MSESILRVRDLVVKRGGTVVLNIPALDIPRGQVVALVGPNGAGKSTLLLALAQLLPIAQGEFFFDGKRIGRELAAADLRRHIAMVFQEPLLLNQSVFDNAALGLKLRGLTRSEIQAHVSPWLDKLGISHLARRSARTLSGGEAQRTSLARALALNPDLLLLDEPFSALDAPTRMQMRYELRELQRELKIPTVFVTHDLGEAYFLADQLAVIDTGTILQVGAPGEILRHPNSLLVARTIGVKNILPGTMVSPSRVQVGNVVLDSPAYPIAPGANVHVCMRSERITLVRPERAEMTSGENALNGELIREMSDGAMVTLYFRADGARLVPNQDYDLQIELPVYIYERLELAALRRWTVLLRKNAMHLID